MVRVWVTLLSAAAGLTVEEDTFVAEATGAAEAEAFVAAAIVAAGGSASAEADIVGVAVIVEAVADDKSAAGKQANRGA